MNNADEPGRFLTDTAISGQAEDQLNRRPFADGICKTIRSLSRGSNWIIGIHGPWGDGKTSVLNFIREDLQKDAGISLVSFNPWRFTDETGMLFGFFHSLASSLGKKLQGVIEQICERLGRWGRFGAPVVGVIPGPVAQVAKEVTGLAAELGQPTIDQSRERLVEALAASDKRVVVLIDDIDRLDNHEIHLLFRLVKACADLPNVVYVLAFDDTIVANALGATYGGDSASGRAFLEKIVQLPLNLPAAASEDLRSFCFTLLNQVLKEAGVELSQSEVDRFVSAFHEGAEVELSTPRRAKRFCNAVAFALPMLKEEVNLADLLLVEALRVFHPDVFEIVRSHLDEFSGVESEHRKPPKEQREIAKLLNPTLEAMPEVVSRAARNLLIELFPRSEAVFGHSEYPAEWLERWRSDRRVCSPEYSERYFTHAIGLRDVADREIRQLFSLAATGTEDDLVKAIENVLSPLKASRGIEKLRFAAATAPPRAAERLAIALAPRCAQIPAPRSSVPFLEPRAQAAFLVSDLLRQIPEMNERERVATTVVMTAEPIHFSSECIRAMYSGREERAEKDDLDQPAFERVRKAFVERVKKAAATGHDFLDDAEHGARNPLGDWRRHEGKTPVEAYLLELFAKDAKQIIRFLRAVAPRAWYAKSRIAHVGEVGARTMEEIEWFVDSDKLASLVVSHCAGDFKNRKEFPDASDSPDVLVAEQFIFCHEKLKQQKPPAQVPQADEHPSELPQDPASDS
ncbi:MAG: P-loop NTPase fold protein [Planctomycetota bacterium]